MTVETIKKRIEGKEKELEKLNKKLERIKKAEATNWEKNPYYYDEHDKKSTIRDILEVENAIVTYKDKLEKEIEKSESRNVTVILDFLEMWKQETIDFFLEEKEKYDVAHDEYRARRKELIDRYNSRHRLGLSDEEIREVNQELRDSKERFTNEWSHIAQFYHGSGSWEDTMKKDIELEKNRKYDNIIERTNKLIGKIVDASGLYIGPDQDLNGFIIGEKGTAEVRTIGAGGYNIQRFHFRTLVKKVK